MDTTEFIPARRKGKRAEKPSALKRDTPEKPATPPSVGAAVKRDVPSKRGKEPKREEPKVESVKGNSDKGFPHGDKGFPHGETWHSSCGLTLGQWVAARKEWLAAPVTERDRPSLAEERSKGTGVVDPEDRFELPPGRLLRSRGSSDPSPLSPPSPPTVSPSASARGPSLADRFKGWLEQSPVSSPPAIKPVREDEPTYRFDVSPIPVRLPSFGSGIYGGRYYFDRSDFVRDWEWTYWDSLKYLYSIVEETLRTTGLDETYEIDFPTFCAFVRDNSSGRIFLSELSDEDRERLRFRR